MRLPFILLFALSTWLMYCLGASLFSPRAGFMAALVFNLSPLFGVAFGTFVLPDGPLDAALLAAALLLARALEARGTVALGWWAATGLAAGIALFSKYSAVLPFAGAFFYLCITPRHRYWLARWEPWLTALIALLVFSPVLVWNAVHHWVSFTFQGGRAVGLAWHPLAPFVVFGGEALFLLPWIWLPLVLSGIGALCRGPREWQGWLLVWLAAPAILLFSFVALWSHQRVLFHWAAPGYLLLFPLLGAAIERHLAAGDRLVRPWLIGTAGFLCVALVLVGVEVRIGILARLGLAFPPGHDPVVQVIDWRSLEHDLWQRGLLDRPGLVVGTVRWSDAAKIDYALDGMAPVIVLGLEPHEFGLIHPAARFRGDDVLIIAPGVDPARMSQEYGALFAQIERLPPFILKRGGRVALVAPIYLGHDLMK